MILMFSSAQSCDELSSVNSLRRRSISVASLLVDLDFDFDVSPGSSENKGEVSIFYLSINMTKVKGDCVSHFEGYGFKTLRP